MGAMGEGRKAETELLENIRAQMGMLVELKRKCDGHWGAEDAIYRFWHGSLKVYYLQELTVEIVDAIAEVCPSGGHLNPWFTQIVGAGTGKTFDLSHNANWVQHAQPIVDAYFHTYYMLDMIVKYGRELNEPPPVLPSGWAAVLELYEIR